MIQRLMTADVAPTNIMQKTGHKRVESILNYGKIDEPQQETMINILSGAETSSSQLAIGQYMSN